MGQLDVIGTMLVMAIPKQQRIGAPGEIRTPDPLVRSQVLYPTELRARSEIIQYFETVTQ